MAIAFANLGASANPDINNNADQTSYANSSWTPPTDGIIVCDVFGARTGGPDTPTMSGNGLTWVQIGSPVTFGTSRRITRFAAIASGATTGATTIDFGGQTQTHCSASFYHVTGVDVSGGIAAAFVQTVTNSGSATSGTVTLAAASHADNRPIACFAHVINEVTTPQTNWTELDDLAGGSPVRGMDTQYRDDAFDTAAGASWATSAAWGGIASEIKAASSGYTITAAQGSFVLSGQAATPKAARLLTAAQGAYTQSGQSANLLKGFLLVAAQGSYVLSGQVAALRVARLLAAGQGSYTLTGQAANLLRGFLLAAAQGSYTLTGQAADLIYTPIGGYTLAAAGGTFALSGQAVNLLFGHKVIAAQGAFVLSGQNANLLKGYLLTAAQDGYTLTGQSVAFLIARRLMAAMGSYVLSGQAVTLNWSGETAPETPSERIYIITADDRLFVVTVEDRTYAV